MSQPGERIRDLENDVAKLQKFKDWCHSYLDGRDVPIHPPGIHGKEGCRIGDRMDWVFARITELETAIRKHRDYQGDDRCYQDDAELYAVLPEGDTRPARETAVTMENCAKYITCRQQSREYVSPQRRIEELEREKEELKAKVLNLERRLKEEAYTYMRVSNERDEALRKLER